MLLDDTHYIQQAIDFSQAKNPVWPFSSLIVDGEGNILCKATDCAHISPLYHAEALARHVLIMGKGERQLGPLKLYSTAEPDAMSQSAIHWANLVHDLAIETVCFGSQLKTLQDLWPFGIDIPAKEIITRSNSNIALVGPVGESDCDQLFSTAKEYQVTLDKKHPSKGVLSKAMHDFYELKL